MLRLRNLTESLEKRYNLSESRDLNESDKLNEKLSDDMPDWFAKRLLTTKYTDSSRIYKRDLGGSAHFAGGNNYTYLKGKGAKKNPNYGKVPDYKQSEYDDQSLFTGLLHKGISLDNVKIIEGPVPISDTDKRLQPPNIPIFLLNDGVVYIPGVNDEEKLGSRKTLGAYKISALLPQCKKFAYIDGNDPDNFKREYKRNTRYKDRSGSIYRADSPEKDRDGNPIGGLKNTYWNKYDKSGYKIIPPAEKYKDKLDEIKAKKIYEIMKEYEDYLTDAQQEIANYISSLSMKEYRLNNDTIERLQAILNNAIGYYVAVDKHINEIVNDTSTTDEEKRDRLVDLINSKYPYRWEGVKQLDREVVRLKDASKDVFNATIDWI